MSPSGEGERLMSLHDQPFGEAEAGDRRVLGDSFPFASAADGCLFVIGFKAAVPFSLLTFIGLRLLERALPKSPLSSEFSCESISAIVGSTPFLAADLVTGAK